MSKPKSRSDAGCSWNGQADGPSSSDARRLAELLDHRRVAVAAMTSRDGPVGQVLTNRGSSALTPRASLSCTRCSIAARWVSIVASRAGYVPSSICSRVAGDPVGHRPDRLLRDRGERGGVDSGRAEQGGTLQEPVQDAPHDAQHADVVQRGQAVVVAEVRGPRTEGAQGRLVPIEGRPRPAVEEDGVRRADGRGDGHDGAVEVVVAPVAPPMPQCRGPPVTCPRSGSRGRGRAGRRRAGRAPRARPRTSRRTRPPVGSPRRRSVTESASLAPSATSWSALAVVRFHTVVGCPSRRNAAASA